MFMKYTIIVVVAAVIVIAGSLFGIPKYRVWTSSVEISVAQNKGKAAMAQADEDRKIAITEAEADLKVQIINSRIEVERAKGMAEAIEIENGKLTPMYIHYLWVRNIDKMDGEKIYIPTEAGLPILEAKE